MWLVSSRECGPEDISLFFPGVCCCIRTHDICTIDNKVQGWVVQKRRLRRPIYYTCICIILIHITQKQLHRCRWCQFILTCSMVNVGFSQPQLCKQVIFVGCVRWKPGTNQWALISFPHGHLFTTSTANRWRETYLKTRTGEAHNAAHRTREHCTKKRTTNNNISSVMNI